MSTIRKAMIVDASRIAEILIFTKRMNYRSIYNDDKVSFGEMQVYPLAKEYIENPDALKNIWVYEDEFVKGIVHIGDKEILELYVDLFFKIRGLGANFWNLLSDRWDVNICGFWKRMPVQSSFIKSMVFKYQMNGNW